MHWNYRLIDLSHENGDEPWVQLHEVFYEDDGTLMGYTPVSMGAESVTEMRTTLEWMALALDKPVLKVTDFPGHTETT